MEDTNKARWQPRWKFFIIILIQCLLPPAGPVRGLLAEDCLMGEGTEERIEEEGRSTASHRVSCSRRPPARGIPEILHRKLGLHVGGIGRAP
jgi:hypothetical protein